jgi:LacI family transcriptional regulator
VPNGERSRHRVTLKDIAREADVSVSTASRVLASQRAGRLPQSPVADRILAVAAELNYEPNLFAASLRTQRTHLIGVLVPHLTDLVLATIYGGIEAAASDLGYQTVVANTLDDPDERRKRVEKLLMRGVDGLVFGDARTDDPYLDELDDRGIPFVLVSRHHAPYPSVTCDDYAGGGLVANHLADLGHRSIAVVAGQPYATTGVDRTAGLVDVLRERGINVPASQIIHSTFDAEGGHAAALGLMNAEEPPTAIFAVNDSTAIGAMGALRDLGFSAGRDVAVVGFNDVSLAGELPIPLTSIRSPLVEMGNEAARMLAIRLRGADASSPARNELRLAPRLIVRESSDPSLDSSRARLTGRRDSSGDR